MASEQIDTQKPRLVGINHVSLEVGSIEEALHFYHQIFSFELRGTHKRDSGECVMAFIDLGDQFLALTKGRHQAPDTNRHFGLVVDDRAKVESLATTAGAVLLESPFLDFLDPWGNRIEVVQYDEVQFTKTEGVLRSQHLHLGKTAAIQHEISEKGMD
jgi:catechol 2,3-dioxygenase-like lactoylglutathione lyase family enzyme